MRTIKFRALKDDVSNCVFYYGSLIYDKLGNPRIHDVDTDLFHTCIKGTESQFIGLKDLSGKEIYEGDFVKIGGLVELVSIIDGMLCCYNVRIYGKIEAISVDDENDVRVCESDYFNCYEIIGNIHENPELIEI